MKAKFEVTSVEKFKGTQENIKMQAVGSDKPYGPNGESEDNTFARFTPMGNLSITITNPELLGTIQPGQKFYLDFTLVAE